MSLGKNHQILVIRRRMLQLHYQPQLAVSTMNTAAGCALCRAYNAHVVIVLIV
jgi:EAL domain-containing protein (putative c-di-GMP-specific phosphodiesterase class I)